ncbi:alpha/beta hydrolase [Pseudomonas aeruginosa]|nr:alpha/beta hydrolase [Pseudomonas aeruginosa]
MPEAFQPDLLRAQLRPLAAAQAEPPEAQAYRQFFRLNFPGATSQLGRMEVGGYEVVTQLWLPPAPTATLVLQHGYYDHMGLYGHVIAWALGMGFAVLACDLPGHGLSSGTRASIGEFSEYQAVFQRLLNEAAGLHLPEPWHLCGQSTGGAIIIDFLLRNVQPWPQVGEILLLAPLVRPRAWGWSQLSYRVLKPFVTQIPRRFSPNSNDAEFLAFIQTDPLQPLSLPTAWVGALSRWVPKIERAPRSERRVVVVQGDADMTVDWRHNLEVLRGKFSEVKLLMLEGGRHHLANESGELRNLYFKFLTEHFVGCAPRTKR